MSKHTAATKIVERYSGFLLAHHFGLSAETSHIEAIIDEETAAERERLRETVEELLDLSPDTPILQWRGVRTKARAELAALAETEK